MKEGLAMELVDDTMHSTLNLSSFVFASLFLQDETCARDRKGSISTHMLVFETEEYSQTLTIGLWKAGEKR